MTTKYHPFICKYSRSRPHWRRKSLWPKWYVECHPIAIRVLGREACQCHLFREVGIMVSVGPDLPEGHVVLSNNMRKPSRDVLAIDQTTFAYLEELVVQGIARTGFRKAAVGHLVLSGVLLDPVLCDE